MCSRRRSRQNVAVRFQTSQWPLDRAPSTLPTISLQPDNWDDYHFKTLWNAQLWLSSGRKVDLGQVKILKHGMTEGRVQLPHAPFERLGDEYCSLGQAISYYETLAAADKQESGIAGAYLTAMSDAATNPAIRASFEGEPGFGTSLLRQSSAEMALEGAAAVISGQDAPGAGQSLSIIYAIPGMQQPLEFSFSEIAELPSRMHAVIGYNGVGKTRLLASLAMAFSVVREERDEASFMRRYGRVVGELPDIAFVLAISYSAFDTFELPNFPGGPTLGLGYKYCGLRKDGSKASQGALKSIDEIREEFHGARATAVEKLRETQLAAIFEPLLLEPSFSMAGRLPDLTDGRETWEEALEGFSTGHTIVLTILVHLCAHLEQRSLVLLDEPEMHPASATRRSPAQLDPSRAERVRFVRSYRDALACGRARDSVEPRPDAPSCSQLVNDRISRDRDTRREHWPSHEPDLSLGQFTERLSRASP